MAAGAKNAVGKGTVVCQQHKAGGVLIQPPGREQPFAHQCRRHQIQYRRLSLAVRGREHPCGFVEHQIHKSPAGNGFACQANLLGVRVCLLSGASHHAVHSHLPLLQQCFDPGLAARSTLGPVFFRSVRSFAFFQSQHKAVLGRGVAQICTDHSAVTDQQIRHDSLVVAGVVGDLICI